MSGKYRMRRARSLKDFETMAQLKRKLFHASTPEPGWHHEGAAWWVIETPETREIIAYGGGHPVKGESSFLLSSAGVLWAHRGKGLQRRLIRVRTAHAKRKGFKRVITNTYQNPSSANNLIACGFRQYEAEWRYMGKFSEYWYRSFSK